MRVSRIVLLLMVLSAVLVYGDSSDYKQGKKDGKKEAESATSDSRKDYLRGYAAGIQDVLGGGGTVYLPVQVQWSGDGGRIASLEIPGWLRTLTIRYEESPYHGGEWRLGIPEGIEIYSFDPSEDSYLNY